MIGLAAMDMGCFFVHMGGFFVFLILNLFF